MTEQEWFDEAQKITCEFVQDDEDLGTLMLDRSEQYREQCFCNGLTPQEALDEFIEQLAGSNTNETAQR